MSKQVIRHDGTHINIKFLAESTVAEKRPLRIAPILPKAKASANHVILKKAMDELEQLVGLENVKKFIYEIYALLHVMQKRKEMGLKTLPQTLHMIFKGNPGTGKTTVARIMGRMFREIGVLEKGHLLEVERGDLVGEYIGHTAIKTREIVKKALGGILFIDEAYSLARGGEKDFGREAIDCLVKAMEDYRDQFVLILAGYPREMDYFLHSNPGLPSRFPIVISFNNYSIDELMAIAELMVQEREYKMTYGAKQKLRHLLEEERRKKPINFSNGRLVRNLIEQAIREHAVRLLDTKMESREELMTLTVEDFKLKGYGEEEGLYR